MFRFVEALACKEWAEFGQTVTELKNQAKAAWAAGEDNEEQFQLAVKLRAVCHLSFVSLFFLSVFDHLVHCMSARTAFT
jgi:hypothetical protein